MVVLKIVLIRTEYHHQNYLMMGLGAVWVRDGQLVVQLAVVHRKTLVVVARRN